MSKLPVVSGAQCVKALEKGWIRRLQAARQSYHVGSRLTPAAQTTVPNHKELDRGTLRAIIRQTGLSVDEFVALL